jgi:hypothetical protein
MEINKKQTAVEWLEEQMKDDRFLAAFEDEFKQAKEMEKQQYIEAYRNGRCDQQSKFPLYYNKTAEQYYNETFKNK